jgi:phosphotransferase system enzyme I (PtsI)
LLLGLGLMEFSMHPANVLEIKRIIIDSDIGELQRKVKRLLTSADPAEMRDLIDDLDA